MKAPTLGILGRFNEALEAVLKEKRPRKRKKKKAVFSLFPGLKQLSSVSERECFF